MASSQVRHANETAPGAVQERPGMTKAPESPGPTSIGQLNTYRFKIFRLLLPEPLHDPVVHLLLLAVNALGVDLEQDFH